MSAPPMGSTMVTPNSSAPTSTASSTSTAVAPVGRAPTSHPPPPSITTVSTMLSTRTPGKTIGLDDTTPWSLPDAMSDPAKVTAPMMTSSTVGTDSRAAIGG